MTLYNIQDYGGIINHVEYLTMGLKQLGHEVDIIGLTPKQKHSFRSFKKHDLQVLPEGTGYYHNQARGWYGMEKVPYLNAHKRNQFIEDASNYDAILWHIPVPTLNKENKGVNQWLPMYDNGTKNIAIVHDGNLPSLYPHLLAVAEKFHAAICVHPAAYHSANVLPMRRYLINNPFEIPENPREGGLSFEQRNGFLSAQIFKAWKRVDTLIKAIPHVIPEADKLVGGAGIEYRYMTSPDKCKPKYYENGVKIWDTALQHGMKYLGVMPNQEVLQTLKQCRLQIDSSWSKKYAAHGAHYNRTTIEAMINGAVPVATDLGMIKTFLKPDVNYIEVPHTATAKQYGEIINQGLTDKQNWEWIQNQNYSYVLHNFEMKNVAQQYIDAINTPAEEPPVKAYGVTSNLLQQATNNLEFFNAPVSLPTALTAQTQCASAGN